MTVAYPTSFGRNMARSQRSTPDAEEEEDDDDDDESDVMRSRSLSAFLGRDSRAYPLITPVILIWLGK